MNIVIFASDHKGWSSLQSVAGELADREHNVFVMINPETELSYNPHEYEKYMYLNDEEKTPVFSETMGIHIPFEPEWLLVSRERWPPEASIIIEFNDKFDSNVGLVEPNAAIFNNVEGILETYSKNRFVPMIDVFFDHSTVIKNQRKRLGFEGNSVVVGNPKYDTGVHSVILTDPLTQEKLSEYYNIDSQKTTVLFYTLINSSRTELFEQFNQLMEEYGTDDYQYFIKPYPGEPTNPLFRHQYEPEFFMDNVTPILEESHIWGMFHLCDLHIGAFSSIFHPPLLLDKKVIDLSVEIGMRERFLDPSSILNSDNSGVESTSDIWKRSFDWTDEQLRSAISQEKIDYACKRNAELWNIVDNGTRQDMLLLFDDFNDGNAGQRIVDYMESY